MRLMIRNMVSERCKHVVKAELKNLGLHLVEVEIGEVIIEEELNLDQELQLNAVLKRSGLEVIHDRKKLLVERTKKLIAQAINESVMLPRQFSTYLRKQLHCSYHYLSRTFGLVEGCSLEKYIISQKVALVQKLIREGKLTFAEIAFRLQYSSTAHLSNQFKKTTGCTPGIYREMVRVLKFEQKLNSK